jgi:magnesium transporter
VEVRWITEGRARQLSPADVADVLNRDDGTLWVDLHHSDDAGMALLSQLFDVRAFEIEECYTRSPVPKVHMLGDHVFIAVNGLTHGTDGRLHFQPVKTFMSEKRLVTVLGPTNAALSAEAAHCELTEILSQLDDNTLAPSNAAVLTHALRATMLRKHERLISALATRVGELEQIVMQSDPIRSESLLQQLFAVRHELQTIRTNAAQTHDLYLRVTEEGRTQGADVARLSDVRQGFEHIRNMADLEREYLQELLDLFETRVSTELNRFVRLLTAWGAIGLAATLIAGIYGMNFANMPELDWQYGYPTALGLMVVVGLFLAAFFRRRGWM